MDNSNALLDLTVYGRQEPWEDSPPGWLQQEWEHNYRTQGAQHDGARGLMSTQT